MGGFLPAPAQPSSGGGSGIPNASVFWCIAHRIALNAFQIDNGDGKITAAMFNRAGQGIFTLDLTTILTTGIFLVQPQQYINVGSATGYDVEINNFARTGNFVPGSLNFSVSYSFWNGAAWALQDPAYFSFFILAQ